AWPSAPPVATPDPTCCRPMPRAADHEVEGGATMTDHRIAGRDEWLQARLELLDAEKELTRRNDDLARRRRELPWVRVDEPYAFDTEDGDATLADLFRGRSQLVI